MAKKLIGNIGSYAFNVLAKTVTITGIANLKQEAILYITNVTRNKTIYNPFVLGEGGSFNTNVLYLDTDLTGMVNTDLLQIWVEDWYEATMLVYGNNTAKVSDSGELFVVTKPATAPPATTPVFREAGPSDIGSSGSAIDTYIIPNTQTLKVQEFFGGAEGATYSSRIELWFCPSGTISSGSEILALGYLASSNYYKSLDREFLGNGAAALVIRRTRMDGTTKEMFAKWLGYLK